VAVINYEMEQAVAGHEIPTGTKAYFWPVTGGTLAAADTGKPLSTAEYSDVSASLTLTAVSGGTGLKLEGTLDPDPDTTEWFTLHDPNGNDIAVTATSGTSGPRLEQILQRCYYIRPNVDVTSLTAGKVRIMLSTTARR
jgi:hypothetical protein